MWVIWRITEAVTEGEVGFRWRSKGLRVKEVQGWNKVVTVVADEWRRVVLGGVVQVNSRGRWWGFGDCVCCVLWR